MILYEKKLRHIGLGILLLQAAVVLCLGKSWPDTTKRQMTLNHCAELLLSSVDTNQIEFAFSRIETNLPAVIRLANRATQDGPLAVTLVTNEDIVSQLKNFSHAVEFNLSKYAEQLTASNILTSA